MSNDESTSPGWFRNLFFILLAILLIGVGGILLTLIWRLIRLILGV